MDQHSSPQARRKAGAASKARHKLLIDNQYLTQAEIAELTGLREPQVVARYRREKKKPGPVTLAGLMADK